MTISKKMIYFIIDLVAIIIFYFAFIYEDAKGNRYGLLMLLLLAFIIVSIIEKMIKHHLKMVFFILLIKICLLLLIEMNSKFAINYFIHAVYLLIILEATFTLNIKNSLIVNCVAFVASMYKFLNLISINNSISNVAQMFLFILINSFVIVIMGFAKYHSEEKYKIDNLYKELLEAHLQLKNYAEKIKEFTVIEERNRIARDLHDTLGHDITGLIMQLEMTSSMLDEDMNASRDLIEQSKSTARDSLKKVRKIVEAFKDESKIYTDMDAIKNLVHEFSAKTGAAIHLDIKGKKVSLSPDIYITLYRIIQEAMTNAIRHGKADKINIWINLEKDIIKFNIVDNGIGCKKVHEGYGLKGMKERVDLLGGFIYFTHEKGFRIEGAINMIEDI